MQPVREGSWVTIDQNLRESRKQIQALRGELDSLRKSIGNLSRAVGAQTDKVEPGLLPARPSDIYKYLRGDLKWVRPVSWGTFTLAAAASTVVHDVGLGVAGAHPPNRGSGNYPAGNVAPPAGQTTAGRMDNPDAYAFFAAHVWRNADTSLTCF